MALAELAQWGDVAVQHRPPVAAMERDGDRTVVLLAGELDIATVEVLTQILAKAIAIDDGDLVVDLSQVTFIDASTLAVLVRGRDFMRLQSREFQVRAPSVFVRRVLEVCGLADLIDGRVPAPWRR
jgi:anti-anti-sigma factor